jgi:hypothetical protein
MLEYEDNICFGCGQENEVGLKLKLQFDDATKPAYGEFAAHEFLEGIPNFRHSGIVATLLDETMITVNKYLEIWQLQAN